MSNDEKKRADDEAMTLVEPLDNQSASDGQADDKPTITSISSSDETRGPAPRYASHLATVGPGPQVDQAQLVVNAQEPAVRPSGTAEFAQAQAQLASQPTFFGASDTTEMPPSHEDISQDEEVSGKIIGGYQIVSVLGQGGMSTVYLAKHQSLNRTAAIKILAPKLIDSDIHRSRFFQEARIVNEVRHPNIVEIYDFIHTQTPKCVALVMQHLKGQSLAELLKSTEKLKANQAVRACYQVCDAVAAVHERGVIHRDLKPDNIFVTANIESSFNYVPSLKVLDFGIAKDLVQPGAHKTKSGVALGTPAYMAPEQISGAESTEKSDVYAVASILYEMLTGSRLFSGDVTQILQEKLIIETPVLIGLDNLPNAPQISALITWGLTRDPQFRPSMRDFTRGLLELEPELNETLQLADTSFFKPHELLGQKAPIKKTSKRTSQASETTQMRRALKRGRQLQWILLGLVVIAIGLGLFAINQAPTPLPLKVDTKTPITKKTVSTPKDTVTKIQRLVKSEPTNAAVVDAQSREQLGLTPLSVELESGQMKRLEIIKKGFQTQTVEINTKQVLEPVKLIRKRRVVKPRLKSPRAPAPAQPQSTPKPLENKDPYQRGEIPGWD